MAFEDIDFVGTPSATSLTIPATGVRVTARSVGQRGGGHARFLSLAIGVEVARSLGLKAEVEQVRLRFGSGADAGLIQLAAAPDGAFAARRDKQGRYTLSINAATADGLFALTFPAFTCSGLTVAPAANGQPARTAFKASDEMLDAE